MMSTFGDLKVCTSIYIKETIQHSDAHQMFDASPKSVLLHMEGLHKHVDSNNPLVFNKIQKRNFSENGYFYLERCDF